MRERHQHLWVKCLAGADLGAATAAIKVRGCICVMERFMAPGDQIHINA